SRSMSKSIIGSPRSGLYCEQFAIARGDFFEANRFFGERERAIGLVRNGKETTDGCGNGTARSGPQTRRLAVSGTDDSESRRIAREAAEAAARAGAVARISLIIACMGIAVGVLGLFLPIT
ncbi:MAG TPA: hypothetical protein VGE84_11075, partial [Allosphingosinicella sp.]